MVKILKGSLEDDDEIENGENHEKRSAILKHFSGHGSQGRTTMDSMEVQKNVTFCEERRTLLGLLSGRNTWIEDINSTIFRFIWALLFFLWCFFMGFTTPEVLAVITIPLLGLFLAIYKNVPEGIIFVFMMRLFDIGDCCIVDNQKIVVKDIGIFTTDFYGEDNKIVSFSNSDLTTKSITNLTRSPLMSETLEVCVSRGTSTDDTKKLESGIDKFLESKPESWSPKQSLLLKEVNKKGLKFAIRVTHSAKFVNFELHNNQRSELLDEVTKILKELGIEYSTIEYVHH